jgi:hypothetical protein
MPLTADDLPPMFLRGNFGFRKFRLPHVMVRGCGARLEEIVNRFLSRLVAFPGIVPALAGGMGNATGETRALRVLHPMGSGHVVAADVTFRRQGENLMIRFGAKTWSWLTYLRGAVAVIGYALLLPLVLGFLLYGTGMYQSWVNEYANQHAKVDFQKAASDKTIFYVNKIQNGYYVTDCTKYRKVLDDPKAKADFDKLTGLLSGPNAMEGFMTMVFSGTDPAKSEFFGAIAGIDNKALALESSLFAYFEAVIPTQNQAVFHETKTVPINNNVIFIQMESTIQPPIRCEYQDKDAVKETIERIFAPSRAFGNMKETYPNLYAALIRVTDESTHYEPPWTPATLARADPKMGMTHMGIPAALLAALVAAAVSFLPPTYLRHPARWLGWPTPDQLEDATPAHVGDVFTILSDTLYHDFRVQKADVTDLAGQ